MHLFWLVLFVPAVFLGQWVWPVLKQRSIWFVITLVVGALLVGWLAMGLSSLKNGQWTLEEVARMLAFRLAVSTDLPLVQLLAASVVGWLRGKRPSLSGSVAPTATSQLAAHVSD